ncbi:hypothetical protein METBIDRAFT_36402 [Metschnikowia bicuspidata var. bicuspidata NRRL YB-4993]|uniref:Uncharacterized protein n=1 Tax=Metschnikowia bicuspidata var. bicuspidata NRRL YB-4993 TaxID=869754 RepID=A0A1A0HGJ5_9ASCO|nr:hypothetical protein METBIDRAFT_36402 [Metschnikowia bicuspidata var. bicuspidata NRRL YB-4993]OBA23115.1 hypothetical protein METBIDRAFT_36402 [Metschnikowia bicuspidata var. bicuspidata NRRL YB-4993]
MLPALRSWTLGKTASVRGYSTLGGPAGSSGFLSDLMKRIDTINMKSEKIAQLALRPTEHRQPSSRKAPAAADPPKKQKMPLAPKKYTRAPPRAKIVVKDHPLSSNMFKLMDEKNFRGGARDARPPGPRQGQNQAFRGEKPPFRGEKPAAYSQGRPQQRNMQPGDRRQGGNRPADGRRNPGAQKARNFVKPASIVPKKLKAAALKPTLSGDVFLHGRPAKLAVCTSSRVAAVAKECLLESHYPYKLPRSIIDNIDEGFSGNRFLLQKDWNLEVDAEHFSERIRKVVRGEADSLSVPKDATPAEQDTCRGLMSNGSLSMDDKRTIYDVVAGVKSVLDLLKNAAWNK